MVQAKNEFIKSPHGENVTHPSRNRAIDLRADRPGNGAPGPSALPYTQPFFLFPCFARIYTQPHFHRYFHLDNAHSWPEALTHTLMGFASRFLRIPRPEVS